jgi:hypothetical protein
MVRTESTIDEGEVMNRPSDEVLVAYADGTLDTATRAETESYLAADAHARALVEALRETGALAVQAFDQPMREPPPPHLVEMIRSRRGRAVSTARAPSTRSAVRAFAMPLAASMAMAVALGAAFLVGRMTARDDVGPELALGSVPAQSQMARLLETQPSGQALPADSADHRRRRLTVVATFRDRDSRPCRELEVLGGSADAQPLAVGVACRSPDGSWVMEGAVRLGAAQSAQGGAGYMPSGSAEKDALEGLLAALGIRQALSASEEQGLIAQRWK